MNVKASGPDGLEAWYVALSACFINFVMAGLGRMSDILYVAFIDIFQVDRLQASVPFSARSLTRNLLGPLVGILGQKYGVRTTTLLGGIIGTLSAVFCFYANNILWITVMWGGLNGAGTALTITLPQVVLGQHFKKYRTTASGMAFSGGCVGSFMFPVLLEYLLYAYGLGGTFLILAGIIMNVIPAAMILKKPSWLKNESKKKKVISTVHSELNNVSCQSLRNASTRSLRGDQSNVFNDLKNDRGGRTNFAFSVQDTLPSSSNHRLITRDSLDTKCLRENQRLVIQLFVKYFDEKENDTFSSRSSIDNLCKNLEHLYVAADEYLIGGSNPPEKAPIHMQTQKYQNSDPENIDQNQLPEMNSSPSSSSHSNSNLTESIMQHIRDLIAEDSHKILKLFREEENTSVLKIMDQLRQLQVLLEEKRTVDLTANSAKKNNISKNMDQTTINHKKKAEIIPENANTFSAHARTAVRLHTNPLFLLISFCRTVHFLTFVPAVTIIVDFAMDKGLLAEDGKYVIAALSLGDLMGRLCLGWVTDKEYLQLPRYMLIVMVIQGACTASLSLMHSKASLLLLIALFGLFQGSLFVRHPVLVSRYLGKDEQSVAMGCFNFFSGLLGFALPNYIGYFRDTIGSYNGIFYINGGIGTLVGIMWFFEPYFVKCSKANGRRDETV